MKMPWSAGCDTHEVAVTVVEIAGGDGTLPLTCRYPADGKARAAVIFCHGLGSSGQAYGLLSESWAAQGYLVVHPTFPDSIQAVARAEPELGLDPEGDLTLWTQLPAVRPRMHQILHDPAYWMARVEIVRRVLDAMDDIRAATVGGDGPLPLAIAGHSFGAHTAQLFAGAEIDLPEGPGSFREERFQAALVLSGQGLDQQGLREGSWDGMTGPVLTVTGKKDGGAKGQDWRWKCEPYELAPAGGKCLAVLGDADHYLGGMTREGVTVPEQHAALVLVTTAFLDAHVAGRASAANWLGLVEDRIGDCPVVFRQK